MSDAATARTLRRVYLLTAAGTIAWLAAVLAAPWLASRGAEGPARALYLLFSPLCHQIPERCFTLGGRPLAVCARCLGIYSGFAGGLALFPLVRGFARPVLPRFRVFLLLAAPMALDALAGIAGVWSSPGPARFATGFLWGTLLPFYFVAGAADLLAGRRSRPAGATTDLKRGPGKT